MMLFFINKFSFLYSHQCVYHTRKTIKSKLSFSRVYFYLETKKKVFFKLFAKDFDENLKLNKKNARYTTTNCLKFESFERAMPMYFNYFKRN